MTCQEKQHHMLKSMLFFGLAGVVTGTMFYEAHTSSDRRHVLIGRSDYIKIFLLPALLLGGIAGSIQDSTQWEWEAVPLNELNIH